MPSDRLNDPTRCGTCGQGLTTAADLLIAIDDLRSQLKAVTRENTALRMRLDVVDENIKSARVVVWALRNDLCNHPHLQRDAEHAHALLQLTTDVAGRPTGGEG